MGNESGFLLFTLANRLKFHKGKSEIGFRQKVPRSFVNERTLAKKELPAALRGFRPRPPGRPRVPSPGQGRGGTRFRSPCGGQRGPCRRSQGLPGQSPAYAPLTRLPLPEFPVGFSEWSVPGKQGKNGVTTGLVSCEDCRKSGTIISEQRERQRTSLRSRKETQYGQHTRFFWNLPRGDRTGG